MNKVMVTGAGGFIGRNLCVALAARGCALTALGLSESIGPWQRFNRADITRPLSVSHFAGQETVIHLAAKVHVMAETPHDERDYFRVNTEGTRHVLQAAHAAKVRRFVFISTVATMSRHGEQLASHCDGQRRCTGLTEEDVIEPDTPYGCSKLEAEKLVLHGGYVPEPVVLRPCVVYGAGAKGNVQRMLRAVVNNRFPPMAEVGNLRSMVHFEDLIQAAILGAEKSQSVGETFIVSDGRNYSTRQIYECMCRAAGKRCPRWTVPFWSLKGLAIAGDLIGRLKGRRCSFDSRALTKLVGSAVFSSRKIESRLGYHPRWDLEAALPGMVDSISQERLGMNTGPVK